MSDDQPDTPTPMAPGKLTEKQEKQWADTKAMMNWTVPGFQHLFFRLLDNNNGEHVALFTDRVPVAATDGKNIILNPTTFFNFPLEERLFIVVHEIAHNMLDDINFMHLCRSRGTVTMNDGKSLPYDDELMNIAEDYRINAMLVKQGIGKLPMKDGKPYCFHDPQMNGTESSLDIYQKLYKQKQAQGGQPGNQPGQGQPQPGQGSFDIILAPGASLGQNAHQAASSRNPDQWATEVKTAITTQRQHGKVAAGLNRMVERILEPEVRWQDHIRAEINRVTGSGGWNWQQPDEWWVPHDFYAPRRTGKGAGWIVIWDDTSGSRSDTELRATPGELSGILSDLNPARVTALSGDAKIHHVMEFTDAAELADWKAKGGGGTSVEPVFDWIRKQVGGEPDLFIGFTDGALCFPTPPRIPIIWASSTDAEYPYGKVVRVCQRPERA